MLCNCTCLRHACSPSADAPPLVRRRALLVAHSVHGLRHGLVVTVRMVRRAARLYVRRAADMCVVRVAFPLGVATVVPLLVTIGPVRVQRGRVRRGRGRRQRTGVHMSRMALAARATRPVHARARIGGHRIAVRGGRAVEWA